jgi:hypothetical protein
MTWFRFALALVLLLPSVAFAVSPAVLVADETSPVVQNTRADNDHLSRMESTAMLRRFVRDGYMVAVPASTDGYYLQRIPASYRYLRPWSKLFLQRLSEQYHAKFDDRLRVTSLVRTATRQRRLERSNANAAEATGPQRSSHLTGATLDISKRFMTPQEQQWMRSVLYSLRQQGHLYAIEEFYQPTFHIMVFRSYANYVRVLQAKTRKSEKLQAKRHPASNAEIAEDTAKANSDKVTP